MRYRRFRLPLRLGERRPLAAFLAPHHLPELVDVMKHRHPFELLFQVLREAIAGGTHAPEFRSTERPAMALRLLQRVQDVRERDHVAVGHVGMPVLAGVRKPDGLSVPHDVGQDHPFRNSRLLIGPGDVDLELAEARGKVLLLARSEPLARKAHYAVSAERFDYTLDLAFLQRLR